LFQNAFDQLGVQVELVALEDLAVLIYKGMSVKARNYHNLDHVFSLIDEEAPILTLTALFHDLVYWQVDRGFIPEIRLIISPYIVEKDGQFYLHEQVGQSERSFQIAVRTFDFSPGLQLTPANGLNEFLSALVMVKKLEIFLDERDLLRLLLCVEASIPFRESAITGADHFYALEARASKIDQSWHLEMGPGEVQAAVKQAVIFANRDVDSFAEADVSCYLETTWKLMPETNSYLRSIETYSIREYRQALQAMSTSMSRLKAERVFHQYRGLPPDSEYQRLVAQARQNIESGRQYLQIKLLTQAILEALAEATGGDAPLSLFMGDLPHAGVQPRRLEDYLPEYRLPAWIDTGSPVFYLLSNQHSLESNFDLHTAPLTLFVFSSLTPVEITELLAVAAQMFDGKVSAREFLSLIKPDVLSPIANACAKMAFTRQEQLRHYVV